MNKFILILMLVIIPASAYSWGEAKSKDNTDIIIIEGDVEGQYIPVPKMFLVPVIDVKKATITFYYGSSNVPIKIMTFSTKEEAIGLLMKMYPKDTFLLRKSDGLTEIKFKDLFKPD